MVNRFEDDESWESTIEEIMELHVTASLIPRGGTWVKYEDLEPIPLTPEWLERCGLQKKYWNSDKDLKLEMYENKAYIGNNFSTNATIIHNINYVHQLQNLYFALTDEELTIKETV